MFNQRKEKMKGWGPVRDRLIEFGYITADPNNIDLVKMTKMGKDYVTMLLQHGDISDSDNDNSSAEEKDHDGLDSSVISNSSK